MTSVVKDFLYDPTGQLTDVTLADPELVKGFTYDDSGNRESANGDSYSVQPSNRYSTAADWSLTYDDEGNVATKTHPVDDQFTCAGEPHGKAATACLLCASHH